MRKGCLREVSRAECGRHLRTGLAGGRETGTLRPEALLGANEAKRVISTRVPKALWLEESAENVYWWRRRPVWSTWPAGSVVKVLTGP
jgi:hypothetical protein